jgi:LysR substrate binding domain
VTVSGSFRSNNAEMLRAAALDGIGIAALPTWAVAEQICSGMLRRVLTAWEAPVSTIYGVYPGNRLMSMKVRAFVDHLARRFGRTPYWEDGPQRREDSMDGVSHHSGSNGSSLLQRRRAREPPALPKAGNIARK